MPQIDTIRDTLKVLEIDGLKIILHHTVKRAIANKVFDILKRNRILIELVFNCINNRYY